jgi:hypothetical protein
LGGSQRWLIKKGPRLSSSGAPAQKDYWEDWLSRIDGTTPAEVVLPDWEGLKREWDAIYLSPWGYATCEARLIKDHGESFFLVGWEPCRLLVPDPLAG